MSLRERGWSIRGAAREIGISRTTANNWSRDYKVYRRGQLVGFVPPLERLAVLSAYDLTCRLWYDLTCRSRHG